MSVQQISKFSSSVCSRCGSFMNNWSKTSKRQGIVSSASFPFSSEYQNRSFQSSAARQRRGLTMEGVQGPLSTPLTWKESRQLLEKAKTDITSGYNPQGVQGHLIHTDPPSSRGSSRHSSGGVDLDETACPQGVQGDLDTHYFNTWLDNCRRYGVVNCEEQLQGIQSGHLTLAQVLADQEARIAEIAESYKIRAHELPGVEDESIQGAQEELSLPEVSAPCPQGVQGDDCVQFKLWLENCHRFGMHECLEQLQGFQTGRLTLAQIFEEQDAMIREVVERYQKKRI